MVLAAGRGRRFGGPKQLALLDGVPLVGHVVATLREAGLDVVVVVGPHGDEVAAAAGAGPRGDEVAESADVGTTDGPTVDVVTAPDHDLGMGASLAAAARAAGARPLVVALADQPGMRRDDVEQVMAALAAGAVAVRIVHPDGPGHPVGFGVAAHHRLVDLAIAGAQPRDAMADLAVVAIAVDHARPADVDVPADLAALADRHRSHGPDSSGGAQ